MNKPKFTPGPWYAFNTHVRWAEPDFNLPIGTLPNGKIAGCCTAKDWPESREEAKANAVLIASAPRYYDTTNEGLKLLDKIIPAFLFICANCPLGRKCKDCNVGKTMKETTEFQSKLEILQKEARGEK